MANGPVPTPNPSQGEEPTIGKLVADASRDISALISKEIELAKSEIKVSVTAGGIGTALLLAAAYILTIAFVIFSVAVAFLINWSGKGLDLKWSFLIVFGAWTALAVLLVLVGIKKLKQIRAPERAIAQGKEIPKALKGKSGK
jgi:hypothetical protein